MSKSKISFIAASIVTIVTSVLIYVNQNKGRVAQERQLLQVKAKLINYELYRYHGDGLTARATGKVASVLDQGKLLCEGRLRLVRIRGGARQEIEADLAEVQFQSDAILSQNNSNVETIELSGNVDYIRGKSRFQTDWIKFTEKTGDAYTDQPVRADLDGQFIAAEGGMTYNMRTESLRMRGGVVGSIRTDVMQNSLGDPRNK
jgi:hypothetical protein